MKILHIVAGMNPTSGGVTQAVRTIIEGLTALGEISEVASLDMPEEKYLQDNNFKVHALGPSKTAWRYSPFLLPWLKKNLGNYKAVIVHGLWQYHSYAVIQALKRIEPAGPKLFVMPHGMLDPYFQKASGRKLKAIRNWVFWKLIEKKIINRADCLLWTCETEKILATKSFTPYHPKYEKVVGLGIPPPPAFTRDMQIAFTDKCGGKDVAGCLLFISRIHPKKGIDLLIKAYSAMERAHALPKLVIAGPGLETSFGVAMKTLAADNENIIFTGMLEGDGRWGAFYSCAAIILPSHQENFGFVVVEAMACGKPVLISNQVNIWREIQANSAGFVDEDTEDGIVRLLQRWQEMACSNRNEMKERAKSTFKDLFSLESSAKQLKTTLVSITNKINREETGNA